MDSSGPPRNIGESSVRARMEAEIAAAHAGSIGGRVPSEDAHPDPAMRSLIEPGQARLDDFKQAELWLQNNIDGVIGHRDADIAVISVRNCDGE